MGNSHAQIVAYGQTKAECISSLQAQLSYEWDAALYCEGEAYYIYHHEKRRYVQFQRQLLDGPCKAVIEL